MATRNPLVMNTTAGQVGELPVGDTLNVNGLLDVVSATPRVRVYSTTNESDHQVSSPAGKQAQVSFMTAADYRWRIGKDVGAESGSSVNADFTIYRYSDAGAPSLALAITRATGLFTIPGAMTVGGAVSVAGPLTTSNGEGFVTGDTKLRMDTSANAGWVAMNGGTIGNASSGATRANADTLALFTLWWGVYTDAQCPLLTSAGAGSTRGASAAADYAANKRMTVFDARDRVPRVAGTIQANGTKLEATEVFDNFGASTVTVTPLNTSSTNNSDGASTKTTALNQVTSTSAGTAAASTAKVRVASLGMLMCVKL